MKILEKAGKTKKGDNGKKKRNPEDKINSNSFIDMDEFADKRKESGNETGVDLDDDVEEENVAALLELYIGYSNDALSMLYTPFFVGLLWVFYDETVVASLYGIKSQDFVFYFLFSLVIIPFQITVDIFFMNIEEWYHHTPIHDYLDYMRYRFATRKARWKGNEDFINNKIEEKL